MPWSGLPTGGGVQSSDDLKSNEAYGILDGNQDRAIVTANEYHNVTTLSAQSETDRVIGTTPNEAYGHSRISDCAGSKNTEEQHDYEYVEN